MISCLLYAGDNHLYVGTYDGIRCIDLSTDDFKTEEILSRHIITPFMKTPKQHLDRQFRRTGRMESPNPATKDLHHRPRTIQ